MSGYTAGSVTAEIKLDTTKFKKAIEGLKGEIKQIQSEFNSVKGGSGLTDDVEKLKTELDSLKKVNEDYRKKLSKVREENEKLSKSYNKSSKSSKKMDKALQESIKWLNEEHECLNKVDKSTQLYRKHFDSIKKGTYLGKQIAEFEKIPTVVNNATASVKGFRTETGKALGDAIRLARESGKAYSGGNPNTGIKAEVGLNAESIGYAIGKKALQDYLKAVSNAKIQVKRDSIEIENAIRRFVQFDFKGTSGTKFDNYGRNLQKVVTNAQKASEALNKMNQTTTTSGSSWQNLLSHMRAVPFALQNVTQGYNSTSIAQEQFKQSMNSVGNGVDILKNRLKTLAEQTKLTFESMQVELAKANAAQYKYWQHERGSSGQWNAQPLPIKGYNDYLKVVEQAKKATAEFEATNKKVSINLNTYKSNLTGVTREMDKMAQSAQRVKNAQLQLQYFQRTDYLNQYKANMGEINKKLAEQEGNARKAGKGLTTFNNGIVQTAHSGRILSNTLYQIRGALLSLKMIFTAMGGMALWGFAMDIAEGVKTTFQAKNELEAQLKLNTKVGESGLKSFNKELDNTISKFQKVNKYQLGETVSSLGIEFNLGMQEMKKAMPIVAMIQSEYIRAGRTSEEAALAVKDILQGEFQRLSRETGVGKEELLAAGWSGDNKDIDSLLDAVKKAGEDRHWDVFAAKATSLNDVIEITKARFEEFGADLLQTISPLVVSGFNTIIGTIDGLKNAFNSLGSFGKNALLGGGLLAGVTGLLTLLPMVTKGMGLAEVATLGWGKSVGTAVLNLNKAEVGAYGFKKALAAVITGTKASDLATRSSTKAILGRILGVNQAVQAEHGLLTALVHSKASLKGEAQGLEYVSMATGNFRQKLIYLSKGIIVADKESATWGKTIKSLITSTRLWGLAIKGVMAIGIVGWLASVAAWADTVKKRVDNYHDILDSGKSKIKSAQKLVDNYSKKLDEMDKSDPKYGLTADNAKVAQHNVDSLTNAYKLAKQIKKETKETAKENDLMLKGGLNDIYSANGLKHVEKYGQEYQEMKMVAYDLKKAEEERYNFEYKSLQHINEHTAQMKEAGVSEEKRIKYITEYSAKAKEAADNLKKFNQGDITAGLYYALNRLQLAWIDLWNDQHFINFWESLKSTWEDVKPTVYAIKDALIGIGQVLLDFFSTKEGQIIGGIAATGTAFALIGTKIYHILGGTKSTIDILKTLGGKLKDIASKWRKAGKEAEEANDKMGNKTPDKSTGGINGDIETGKGKGKFSEQLGTQLKQDAIKYARAAVAIAAGMLLITEAILLLKAPMGALANVGEQFKAQEPQIRSGIEGLQLIAPVVLALLPPVIALAYIFGKFDISVTTILKGALSAAVGIAAGMLMVAEAIYLLKAPMWALSQIGQDYAIGATDIQGGIDAINAMGQALQALAPFVPVFAAGIALGIATFLAPEIMLLVDAGIVVGIAGSMLLLAEAIVSLRMPLEAIRELGNSFTDIEGVKKGADAIRVTAEALKYVEEATRSLTGIVIEDVTTRIMNFLTGDTGSFSTAVDKLVGEDGVLDSLNKFAKKFSEYTVIPIDAAKAQALAESSKGIDTVSKALQTVKDALDNIPDEFKKGNDNPLTTYNQETGQTDTTIDTSYFEQFKEPLEQLSQFITDFNNMPIVAPDAAKVEAINQASTFITSVKTAIDNVKAALGASVDAGWNANMASGGITAAISGFVMGLSGGSGEYSSSLGSSLEEMYNAIKDIMSFTQKVNGLAGGEGEGGGNVSAAVDMVTAVDNALQNLNNTLSQAAPQVKENAKAIGTGISDGIKEGMANMSQGIISQVTSAMDSAKPYAYTYGQGIGGQGKQGFQAQFKIADAVNTELGLALQAMENKKQEFYDKGYALGEQSAKGFKDGEDHHSPGIIARTMMAEMGYVNTALDDAIATIPQKSYVLGQTLADNFTPAFATDFGVQDMSLFENGLNQITAAATNTNLQTSTAFNTMNMNTTTSMQGMTSSVNGAFNNIQQNTTTRYGQLVNTTRVSLNSMQSQTTKNINAIRQSWRGMQNALIASAENIRSETSAKIHTLESNMASFWNKVQNPALLLASGNPTAIGTKPRQRKRLMAGSPSAKGTKPRRAAGKSVPRPKATNTQLTSREFSFRDAISEYLLCLLNGGVCAAGGWNFNWSPDIKEALLKWHTHFGEIYDDVLTVGKFENDDFPVRGNATIAKRYIGEKIASTNYEFYWNDRYDPITAWNRGSFNCVDGARLAIALAEKFGFGGGYVGYGSWAGTGHGFAVIPGLGVIDATALQNNYGFTSPKVSGYPSAGLGTIPQNRPKPKEPTGETHNYNGDVNVHINVYGDDVEVNENKVDKSTGKAIIDLLGINPATGQ